MAVLLVSPKLEVLAGEQRLGRNNLVLLIASGPALLE
jgi:hypothetical protein